MSHHAHAVLRRDSRADGRLGRAASLAIVLALAGVAGSWTPALAQEPFDAKSAAHLRDAYLADLDTIHSKIIALANAIPASKYSWRPTAGVRSISEALMHVASEWYFYGPRSVSGDPPADFGVPREKLPALEKITAKNDVIAELDKSWTHCKTQISAVDPGKLTGVYKPWGMALDQAAFGMTGDLHEHLGQLIAYARSVGVKPPWTKGP